MTPRHEDVAVESDVRGPYGALMESYPGLVLSVGTLRAQTAKALYLAMRIGDEANARQAVLAGDARGQRSSDTWVRSAEHDTAFRLWVAKVKVMQHPRPVTRALARTRGRTIIITGDPPEGMRRRAGERAGEGRAGLRWETIRDRISQRDGRPIAAVRTGDWYAQADASEGGWEARRRNAQTVEFRTRAPSARNATDGSGARR